MSPWWVVLVTPRELPEEVIAFGPYRSQAKADALVETLGSPWAADYRDPEEYEVYAVALSVAE